MASARKPPRNFRAYGTMEAANVVLVPGLALVLAPPGDLVESAALLAAILPTSGLLVVGAIYWWAMSRRLTGSRSLVQRWLVLADRSERPLVLLLAMATVLSIGALLARGFTGTVIAALVLTLLGWLEYVNYYHRQLQHFDNWADFKRLIATRKLRQAHSARDLAAYRRGTR